MESATGLNLSIREQSLNTWLLSLPIGQIIAKDALAGDASFRRYYRIKTQNQSYILMDAPPPQENCRPFVNIARALRARGLQTPEIFAEELTQGFLLLSDFGDITFLKALNKQNADQLYDTALSALAELQADTTIAQHTLPVFNAEFMWQEWQWHKEWFLEKFLHVQATTALAANYQTIIAEVTQQPLVLMHRDFHSANLMVLPNAGVGILDFQDAFIGPVTYDLASLLRDCYIDWPAEKVKNWALSYLAKLQAQQCCVDVSAETFLRWFDFMSMQRHLKALLTFARKKVRDEQPQYLQHVPRTLNYVLQVSAQYPELQALHQFYAANANKVVLACAQ